MNIVIFGKFEVIPEIGGTERVSASLAKMLIQRGCGVYFVAWQKYPHSKPYTLDVEQIVLPNGNDMCCEENIRCFSDFITEKKIDVILNQYGPFDDFSNLCIIVKERTKTKLLSAIHFDPDFAMKAYRADLSLLEFRYSLLRQIRFYLKRILPFKLNRWMKEYSNAYNRIYKESDAVILLSEHFKPIFKKMTGLDDISKLVAIPNSLSFEVQEESYQKKKQILWIGRFDLAQKRPERMVQIWSYLEKHHSDWNVVFLGDGPCRPMIEKYVKRLVLKNVEFKGFIDPVNEYKKSSIICVTSTYEGFGLILTEAMQFGTVPVAFDSYESLCDIVEEGVNGYRIKPFDSKMFASRLSDLMMNEELRKKMSNNAKQHVLEKFCPDKIAAQWMTLFNKIQ